MKKKRWRSKGEKGGEKREGHDAEHGRRRAEWMDVEMLRAVLCWEWEEVTGEHAVAWRREVDGGSGITEYLWQ